MKIKQIYLSLISIFLILLFATSFLFSFLDIIDYGIMRRIAVIFFGINIIFEGVTNYHFGKPVEPSKYNKWFRFFYITLGTIVISIVTIQLLYL